MTTNCMISLRAWYLIAVLPIGALHQGCAERVASETNQGYTDNVGFTLSDLKGKETRLSDFRGKVVLLAFWGACCPKGRESLQVLQNTWDQYRDQGFELISINKDPPDKESTVRQIVHRYRYRFPVLLDRESDVSNRFNPRMVFPFHVLLDRQGRITNVFQGYRTGDEFQIEEQIKKLL